MYAPDTILTLKEQRSTDDKQFAYDRVRVVGQSPVSHTSESAKYSGEDAKGVIITPLTEFAGNLDEPFGKVRKLYDVESEPVYEEEVKTTVRRVDATTRAAGPTPEDIFAEQAAGDPNKPRRPGSPTSPLVDPSPPSDAGPLGEAEGPSDAETPVEDPSPL